MSALVNYTSQGVEFWACTNHPFDVAADTANLFGISPEQVRVHVPYVGGNFGAKHNCREMLAAAALSGEPAAHAAVSAALDAFAVGHLDALPVRALSQGQKRRVALSRLALSGRRLWLLDEPLAALDAAATQTLAAMVDALLGRGGIAVLTSHQPIGLRAQTRVFAFS